MPGGSETASVREVLLDGLLSRDQLGAEMGWSDQMIARREAEGLPVIELGRRRFYSVEAVRAWIISGERNRPPSRQRRQTEA